MSTTELTSVLRADAELLEELLEDNKQAFVSFVTKEYRVSKKVARAAADVLYAEAGV